MKCNQIISSFLMKVSHTQKKSVGAL